MGSVIRVAVVIFLGISSFGSRALPDDVLDQASGLPVLLDSLEMTYETLYPRQSSTDLKVDGDKFYIKKSLGQGVAVGFDGTTYWAQRQNEGKPTSFSKNAFSGIRQLESHPLISPYLWAWDSVKVAEWSHLRSVAFWQELRKRLEFIETRDIRGEACDVYKISNVSQGKYYEVAFSKQSNGFPIQTMLQIDDQHFSTLDVLATHIDVSGAVVGTEFQVTKPGKEPFLYHRVLLDTLKVNQQVEPSIFSMDPTGSELILDLDQKRSPGGTTAGGGSSRIFLLVIVITALILTGIVAFRLRKSQ